MNARIARNWDRLNGPQRIGGIDTARGLAVIGMLAAHMAGLPVLSPSDPSTWGAIATGRSSILFATLAGVSVAIVTGGTRPVRGRSLEVASWRLAMRAAVIFAIGLVLIVLGTPLMVILPGYAILFLLAIPLLRMPHRWLAPVAVVLGLVTPFIWAAISALPVWESVAGETVMLALGLHYPFVVWISFLVAGMAVGRLALRRVRIDLVLIVVGGVIALAGYAGGHIWRDVSGVAPGEGSIVDLALEVDPHSSGVGEVFGSGGFAVLVIGLALLVTRGVPGLILSPIRAVGSMPLTAYSAQIVIVSILLAGVSPDSKLDVLRDLNILVPFVIGTVVACSMWAVLVGRGPLEWLVDIVVRRAVPSDQSRAGSAAARR